MKSVVSPAAEVRLAAAESLLRGGKVGQAIDALRSFISESPRHAGAHYQLAVALLASGDQAGAEQALRASLKLNPNQPNAAVRLANILTSRRDAEEAVKLLAPFAGTPAADIALLTVYAMALKTVGRVDEATSIYERAVRIAPTSGIAEHNLAGAYGDAERFAESNEATARAFAKGLDAPETWLIHGRALQGLGDFDGAEVAYRQAILRRQGYADAHAELAQLIWMRTENVEQSLATLDAALAAQTIDAPLSIVKSRFLEYAGDKTAAMAALADALSVWRPDPNVLLSAANLALATDPPLALSYAEKAMALAPQSAPARTTLCQVYLGIGRADEAMRIAEDLCRSWPLDQYPVALLGTAWRLLGDPRYRQLYDYERLVRAWPLETPDGWQDLESFLADLAASLRSRQQLRGHPIGQSLRKGAQAGLSLARSDDPTIAAFFKAIDAPIRGYIAILAEVDDLLGRRVRNGYRFAGAWSALLRPGGFHVNHLHPQGWISSACHIDLPPAVEEGHQGWLQFGEPGLKTTPPLAAEHFVKPRAGQMVLFPSYMWHGTVPFDGDKSRLTVAFDLVPD